LAALVEREEDAGSGHRTSHDQPVGEEWVHRLLRPARLSSVAQGEEEACGCHEPAKNREVK
jgi:hypothetical protein